MTIPTDIRPILGPENRLGRISSSGEPALDRDGEAIWLDVIRRMEEVYSVLLRNETDLERKNTELEEAQTFISSVIESVSDVLIVCNNSGEIRTANRAFLHLVGEKAPGIAGRQIADFLVEESRDHLRRILGRNKDGAVLEIDLNFLQGEGQPECLAMRCAPLFDNQRRRIGAVLTGRPISELRRAYQALNEAHEELKRAQGRLIEQEKMASLGRLVAGVAHELNNPISFVYGNIYTLDRYRKNLVAYLDQLHRGDLSDADHQARKRLKIDAILADIAPLLEGTLEGADRISEIVKNLRRLSFSKTGERESVDLDKLIRTAAQLAARAKNSSAHFIIDSPGQVLLDAHEGQIHQVIVNLIDNALDAVSARPGGTITLTLRRIEMAIELRIADNGPGIAASNLGKIFEPFFTTKTVGEGTGLGLWISFSIVRDYGGTISVQNNATGGAEFTIIFPQPPPRGKTI
jgi:two-component system, NtrC family, sensor histidine kinase HupT/HoxJ